MSESAKDTPSVTEKQAILRERAAYIAGLQHCGVSMTGPMYTREARREYPMPKVTRPRVVTLGGYEYRVVDGELEYRHGTWNWRALDGNADRVRALADLLANPVETVEADEDNS